MPCMIVSKTKSFVMLEAQKQELLICIPELPCCSTTFLLKQECTACLPQAVALIQKVHAAMKGTHAYLAASKLKKPMAKAAAICTRIVCI